MFAAVIMIFSGIMTLLGGMSAIAEDVVFLATRHYVHELDLTGWGSHTPWWALSFIAIDALVVRGICVAPRPMRD
ncbi:hypothetical protein ABZS88_39095 [Streptomyces sp. NPDC005480]|uniref:DUF7144 family membrane protein n=1 Tax=Streptomyces sp. NPDC005480 TaxID=3154880 RepID=UPI0033A21D30